MSSKLVLPVALGVSLVAASALLVYYVLKKDEDDEQTSPTDTKETVKTSRRNIIEVSVPKSIVPALIGRGGSNIKDIEKKSGASIIFKKFPEKDADICLIRGNTSDTQIAENLVREFIRNQPTIVEDTISVPAWACGRIIGSGGESIKDISHRSGARVKVEGGRGEVGQRLINIRGTTEQISAARELILELVAHQRCLREIEQSKPPRVPTPTPAPAPATAPDAEETGESLTKHAAPSKRAAAVASVEVYVSAVSSPSRFWVQLVGPQTAQLDQLVEHMTEYYASSDNREIHKLSSVSIGQVVAAVFRHDGRWYRARVIDLKPNEFAPDQQVADVFYLDYGDSEFVATHELCELRADLLRLRFQAMECFLAGVRPAGPEEETVGVTADGERWDKWQPGAIARFETLTKVARWQSLMAATCTYRRGGAGGERDKEIPGMRLYDVTPDGEVNIGEVLIDEGWAVSAPVTPRASPRPSPNPPASPLPPFGDLGASRVLGMTNPEESRQSRDRPQNSEEATNGSDSPPPRPPLPAPAALSYPRAPTNHKPPNGTDRLLDSERLHHEENSPVSENSPVVENLVPRIPSSNNLQGEIKRVNTDGHLPLLTADPRDELKANINRLDSHHNLQDL